MWHQIGLIHLRYNESSNNIGTEKPFFQTCNFILQILLKSAGANISMQSAKQSARYRGIRYTLLGHVNYIMLNFTLLSVLFVNTALHKCLLHFNTYNIESLSWQSTNYSLFSAKITSVLWPHSQQDPYTSLKRCLLIQLD